ncbi:MAG: hypothetical protein IJP31_02115 [Lachnospiraceae bacterium]|nr:hypothetical protein [Lachnospiraceae bacterium]
MGAISQVEMSAVNSTYDTAQTQKTETKKAQTAAKTGWADSSVKTNTDYGKTIGEPELSDKAREYYEKLKSKFGNLDFILVSKDMKDVAKAQAARYANPNKMVVLIDEEKIERMATDEAYREKYEAIIANGSNQLSQIASQLGAASSGVKAFGMQVEDNRASFFAAVDKSFAQQRERIAERREEKKAEKKAAEKKAEKKEKQEAIEEKREAAREEKAEKAENAQAEEWKDTIGITADSADGLVKQIQNLYYEWMTNNVQTDAEKMVGQNLDLQV